MARAERSCKGGCGQRGGHRVEPRVAADRDGVRGSGGGARRVLLGARQQGASRTLHAPAAAPGLLRCRVKLEQQPVQQVLSPSGRPPSQGGPVNSQLTSGAERIHRPLWLGAGAHTPSSGWPRGAPLPAANRGRSTEWVRPSPALPRSSCFRQQQAGDCGVLPASRTRTRVFCHGLPCDLRPSADPQGAGLGLRRL